MKSLAVTLLVVLLMMLGTVARRTTLCSPTPMVIQGSQASRAPEASEDIGRRVFELDPAMLILMGLPCVASAASAGADRGGEERDHEGGDRDDLQGHLDSRGWGLRAPRYQASAKVWTMTATDHARTFPCGSNIDTRPDERLWHRHRRSEGSSLQIAVGDEPVKQIRHALSPAVPAEAATVTIA